MWRRWVVLAAVCVLVASAGQAVGMPTDDRSGHAEESLPGGGVAASAVGGHPRLLVRESDLPGLRARAVNSNPVYRGLRGLAEEARGDMDAGLIPSSDGGSKGWEMYPTERFAQLFAFMSLVGPVAERADYAGRAHDLLMYVVGHASRPADPEAPFRDPVFAVDDRSRWNGEAFALTLDWVYDEFNAAEKQQIHDVFVRWVAENKVAEVTSFNHPTPVGVVNDPVLLEGGSTKLRYAANNYFAAHMRNIGLMALAFDPADDPGGQMRDALRNATGAWLYVTDHLLRTDMAGGLGSEGWEYGPQTLSYIAQFLTALHTAGQDDPAVWGPQVVLANNPFWADVLPAYMASLSPRPKNIPAMWRGPVYQPAWYGSAQTDWMPDLIGLAGPLTLYAQSTGDSVTAARLRWIQTYTAPGGAAELEERVRTPLDEASFSSILYFLALDPTHPATHPVTDPRPSLPLSFTSPGLGKTLTRTGWGEDASLFGYTLGWNSTNHQSANGNHIELYRDGEWLFKQRTGYDVDYLASDNHNTLAIENDEPDHSEPGDYRRMLWKRGSQWLESLSTDDGHILAQSNGNGYFYATGDATDLYNSQYESSTDVRYANRSVMWLKPDIVVTYDRAATKSAGHFKRYWLNVATKPTVRGRRATVTTPGRQRLDVDVLLPAKAVPRGLEATDESDDPAVGGEMHGKLLVEAPGDPKSTRFLNVIQAGRVTATPKATGLIRSTRGTPYDGATIRDVAVLFPVDVATSRSPVRSTTYRVPAGVRRHYVTGLTPRRAYQVELATTKGQRSVSVRAVTGQPGQGSSIVRADAGGVLTFTQASLGSPTDHTPPGTLVVKRPKKVERGTVARFKFRSNEARVTFQCRLDRARWKSCKRRTTVRHVELGGHVLRVRAVDRAGNRDGSPAVVRWKVRRR